MRRQRRATRRAPLPSSSATTDARSNAHFLGGTMVTGTPTTRKSPPIEQKGRASYGALTALAVGALSLLYLFTAAKVESFGSDTSTNFGLAEDLRHQHAYWFDFQPHTVYPPGYPLLL